MNTSDIIAIVAIVVSAIVSIITTITSYRSTKLNVQSRRLEMAFEKQIEAFREVAEKMSGIRKAIVNTTAPSNEPSRIAFYSAVETATLDYVFTYQRYRVYLPSDLDAVLREFSKKAISYYSEAEYEKHQQFIEEFNRLETNIVKIMNKHMGIN